MATELLRKVGHGVPAGCARGGDAKQRGDDAFGSDTCVDGGDAGADGS